MDLSHSSTDQSRSITEEKWMLAGDEEAVLPSSNAFIVEGWRRRSSVIENQANDAIVSLYAKGIETMSRVLSQSYPEAKIALEELNAARELLRAHEIERRYPIRDLLYGFIQTLHITINQLVDDRNEMKIAMESWKSPGQIHDTSFKLPSVEEPGMVEAASLDLKRDGVIASFVTLKEIDDVEDVKPAFDISARRVVKKSRKWLEKHGRQNVLECPECTYSNSSTYNFLNHLKENHDKTMRQCAHSRLSIASTDTLKKEKKCSKDRSPRINTTRCGIKNALQSGGTKCVNCSARPKTACGYVKHISARHRMSLHKAGIDHLLCACGLKATSNYSFTRDHSEKCGGYDFKIIRLSTSWKVKLEDGAD